MPAQTWVVMNDLQIPFQDPKAVALVLDFVKDLKPHGVILNGDVVDCYALSTFDKNPLTPATLALEITLAGNLMTALAPYTKERHWLGGNHEDRLRRFLWSKAPMFQGLGDLEFRNLFHLVEHGFQWAPYGDIHHLGKLAVTHGSIVRQHSGLSARAHYDKYGQSVLVGHTHRLGAYYHSNLAGVHGAWENGCLCLLTPEYAQHPDWQLGFSVVHVESNGQFQVELIPVIRSEALIYGGRRYGKGGK
jgi:predicted phosphodiesterase